MFCSSVYDRSGQHMTYIKNNLDNLKKKCDEFHACTVELYNAENFHRVLSGENIQLKNICGYVIFDNTPCWSEKDMVLAAFTCACMCVHMYEYMYGC